MLERLAATDAAAVKADDNLQYAEAVGLGYQGITVNIGNGDRAKNPLGEDARLRQAFELAIDRAALNQVVFEGAFAPGNQPFRSEEHTSELQSLMRNSYAVFCLKKKTKPKTRMT